MHRALERLLVGRAMAGRYVLEEPLGRGGMSVVYRAMDQTLGRRVALKLIQHAEGSDELREHLRQRFRREAGSAARIPPHPNVVRIYDYGTDPELDLDFIVMELLEGQDLKSALERNPPTLEEAIRILLEAARGIAAGHRAGVLHRDIKPGNIFLGERDGGGVRVLDFGIAKLLETEGEEDLTLAGYTPYSPAYVSPEQLDPYRSLTPASDVYQLGLVGYELLAGAKPFTPAERERLRGGEPLPVPIRGRWAEAPSPVRAVIERALRLNPRERYRDAAAFAEDLAAAARGDLAAVRTSAAAADDEDDYTMLAPFGADSPADDDYTIAAPLPPESQVAAEGTLLPSGAAVSPEAAHVAAQKPRPAARKGLLRFPLLSLGAVLLLAGLIYVAILLLEARPTAIDPAVAELENVFRELESEASRRLERAGEWDRP